MYGIVDGNKIRLFSSDANTALYEDLLKRVPFTFHGTATNDKIEGGIHLGEFLAAKGFTATRSAQAPNPNIRITIPENLTSLG
jgi:hypothetical protein